MRHRGEDCGGEGRLGKAEECEVNTCQKHAPRSSLLSALQRSLFPGYC